MNIVKLQNDLKDLSDQQLLGSMQTGSAPQYLVLAEMQRRKKMRDEVSTQAPQNEGTVADEIMGGITQLPMGGMDMASGGLVSFAKGGYAKGEAEACWTNPETGEQMCPPSKPDVRYPKTGQRKEYEAGGIVALQAGGTASEARMMLANMGVDTAGLSDEQVMELAAAKASNGVVEAAGPNATGVGFVSPEAPTPDFSPVPATAPPMPPVSTPEAAPPAQSGFMDKLTGGISTLLGIGDATAEEVEPAPTQTGVDLVDLETQQELTKFWESPQRGPYDYILNKAKENYDDADQLEAAGLIDRAQEARATGDKLVKSAQQLPIHQQLLRASPEVRVGQAIARAEDPGILGSDIYGTSPETAAELIQGARQTQQAMAESESPAAKAGAARMAEDPRVGAQLGTMTQEEAAKRRKDPKSEGQDAAAQQQAFSEWLQTQKSADPETRDDLLELYKELRAEREESKKGAKSKGVNEALMRMGMAMMSSKNPDFMGALGEGGLEGLKAYGESQKAAASEQELALKEAADLLAAREGSLYKGLTGQSSIITGIQKEIERLSDPLVRLPTGMTQVAFDQYRQNRIKALEARLSQLLQVGAMSNPYGLSPTTAEKLDGISR